MSFNNKIFTNNTQDSQNLKWVIKTPTLFSPPLPFCEIDWIQEFKHSNIDHLYSGPNRIGFYYQWLWLHLIQQSSRYQLIAEEIQLNDKTKTIGALDFLVEDTHNNQIEHWEVAVKFYLLHKGLWHGPNGNDRLDIKLSRMLNHQLKLTKHPAFKDKFPIDPQSILPRLIMQGRLYLNPFEEDSVPTHCMNHQLNPALELGSWCFANQAHLITEPLYLLERAQWLNGDLEKTEHLDVSPKSGIGTIERSVHAQSEHGHFWFIVPNNWEEMCNTQNIT
ncbi:DUF1853 family protein [Vibrio sp. Of7-15]|uniref:DUF1853 family protein n=1 Tax=Vibrio sp. Of7-15 TaxID=2724879 RepID=UPI001EF1C2B7|nr:DUF1853 family protein [Vibrio sp. Of7-15]MCG7495778.1 DUF1853 family protein [Vibrio sp. Of7-15]